MKVETASESGEMSIVYRLTKQLCRHIQTSVIIVNDKGGNPLTTEEPQAKRWAEHFLEVLNRESVTMESNNIATSTKPDILQSFVKQNRKEY